MERKEIHSKRYLLFSVSFVLTALCYSYAFGATIRVPEDYPTIQAGINATEDGDIVIVADGTYVGLGNKDLDFSGKSITVKSANGPAKCVIDCQGNGRGFYFHSGETQSSVLYGFTITNGSADYGGGIRCSSSPVVANCKIIANTAEKSGGGIFCSVWSCDITNCTIIDNTATWGGGIYISYARTNITNCTITRNKSKYGGGIYIKNSGTTITNCILWGDNPSEFYISHEPGSDFPNISYCDIETYEVSGPTIIHSNPLFVDVSDPDPIKWDLHLQPSSPCVDSGSNDAPGIPDRDFEGDSRIFDGNGDGIAIADMGVDEYVVRTTVMPCIPFLLFGN